MLKQPPIGSSAPWRACIQCIRQKCMQSNSVGFLYPQTRLFSSTHLSYNVRRNPLRSPGNARRLEQEAAQYKRSMIRSAAGVVACTATVAGLIKLDPFGLEQANKKYDESNSDGDSENKPERKTMKLDGPEGFPSGGPSVIRVDGQDRAGEVPTGSSTIPYFPSTIRLPKSLDASNMKVGDEANSIEGEEEYQLIGLGVRSAPIFRVEVYVVGMYIVKADISELQQRLIRTAIRPPGGESMVMTAAGGSSATSLVPAEREQLKDLLLDPERGDAAWNAIIKDKGLRTAFYIIPTRDTDFTRLRDGWIRGISARVQHAIEKSKEVGSTDLNEFQGDSFDAAVNDLQVIFGGSWRRDVSKGHSLILMRNEQGSMDALYRLPSATSAQWMGRVKDERISRLIWLNYLAGKTVSSEEARSSVVNGVIGIVERPVGTVVQKVV